jgi:signal transduction histidine kinase
VSAVFTDSALRRLFDAGRALVSELDVEAVLDRVLSAATEVTGARYAALGVLDEHRLELERFVTHGIPAAAHAAIGDMPRGRGLLGAVIADSRPLRTESVTNDPRSFGFPAGHPPMVTFLGVPVLIRGAAWGNLYLCEKAGGEEFSEADEEAIVVLAEWAAIAIENARLYQSSELRRAELERAVRRLEATTTIARAVGGETDLERILELIAGRGRALLDARGLVILLRDADGLKVAACAGEVPPGACGSRLDGEGDRVRGSLDALGVAAADAVLVPLIFHGQSLGMLAALGGRGDADDERLLQAFAASAATAVATARSVEEQRLRDAMRAAEEERRRWARELHDDTLQALGGLRMMLAAARRSRDPVDLRSAVDEAVVRIEEEIDGLRALIRELRPAALDELGPTAAIEDLALRATERHGIAVTADVRLPAGRLPADLETALYRIVQEALTNAVRHAGAQRIEIAVTETGGIVHAQIRDDGSGFDPGAPADGFGLTGVRERVALLHGELEISSSTQGTTLSAALPAPQQTAA